MTSHKVFHVESRNEFYFWSISGNAQLRKQLSRL